jgi:ubiquinone/menaquinone biosynthesis C-methylase UbiE
MKQWNKIFRQYGRSYISSQKNMPKIAEFFRKNDVKRVLDLGCGTGRHMLYLARRGFEVYGIDVAKEGIKIARQCLKDSKIRANLKVGSIYEKLPYQDNFFDAVISIRVIHHAGIKDIKKLIREIKRILKPKGLIFVTVRKKISQKSRLKFKAIAPRTYVPMEGDEKGVIHYLFNKELLMKEFQDFKIHDFWIDLGSQSWERYYCLLGELKK